MEYEDWTFSSNDKEAFTFFTEREYYIRQIILLKVSVSTRFCYPRRFLVDMDFVLGIVRLSHRDGSVSRDKVNGGDGAKKLGSCFGRMVRTSPTRRTPGQECVWNQEKTLPSLLRAMNSPLG
jgi:hypothetical protein